LFQELGDEHYVGIVTFNLAWALSELGDRERARSLNAESLRHARELGDKRSTAFTLGSLAADAQREGRLRDALAMLQESLGLRLELLDPVHTATDLSQIASALAAAGVSETAIRLLACSQKLYEEMGTYVPVYVVKSKEETLDAVRARLDADAIDRAWKDGRRLTVDEGVALALESSVDERN